VTSSRNRNVLIAGLAVIVVIVAFGAVIALRWVAGPPGGYARPLAGASGGASGSAGPAVAGDPGGGDAYFPGYGNGGYDVERYQLKLRYDPTTDRLSGVARVTATASQTLSRFNLDFGRLSISTLKVNDVDATSEHNNKTELTVIPAAPLPAGRAFTVDMAYSGTPIGEAFNHTASGAVVLGERSRRRSGFPPTTIPRTRPRTTSRSPCRTG